MRTSCMRLTALAVREVYLHSERCCVRCCSHCGYDGHFGRGSSQKMTRTWWACLGRKGWEQCTHLGQHHSMIACRMVILLVPAVVLLVPAVVLLLQGSARNTPKHWDGTCMHGESAYCRALLLKSFRRHPSARLSQQPHFRPGRSRGRRGAPSPEPPTWLQGWAPLLPHTHATFKHTRFRVFRTAACMAGSSGELPSMHCPHLCSLGRQGRPVTQSCRQTWPQ